MKKVLILILFLGCTDFNPDGRRDQDLFNLDLENNIIHISDSAVIGLKWDEISVVGFKEFRIERKYSNTDVWLEIKTIKNRIVSSYDDIIYDDEDLDYRVAIIDSLGNARWAEASTEIPKTTLLYVPDEQSTPGIAFSTKLIDDGDTILVKPGEYSDALNMLGKTVVVSSTAGFEETFLLHRIVMNQGKLAGFTIKDGRAEFASGGGIKISGTGIVENCYITQNNADEKGGGIMLSEQGEIYNSIIFNNISGEGFHNFYMVKAEGKVINNTILFTDTLVAGILNVNIYANTLNSGFLFLNNIVMGGDTTFFMMPMVPLSGVTIDYSIMDTSVVTGANIILENPQFMGLGFDPPVFNLELDSPAVNSGHPDLIYNNSDGSRNTMGAYGGPGGEL